MIADVVIVLDEGADLPFEISGRRGRCRPQPALAGLQELLRPAVIHRGGNAFPAAQLRDVLLAAQSFQHNADLLFGRILLPRRPANVADKLLGRTSGGNGFLSHLRSLAATMSQKSSVPQATKFVSQALKQDSEGHQAAYRYHQSRLRFIPPRPNCRYQAVCP